MIAFPRECMNGLINTVRDMMIELLLKPWIRLDIVATNQGENGLHAQSDSLPSWTPSPALVALRCIWDDIAESCNFSKWLQHCPINGFKEANEFLSSLPRDTDEDCLEEWQAMDSCIETAAHGGSLNIHSWCMAMFWRMMPDGLSYPIHVGQFIHLWNESHIWHFDFLPPPMPAPEFRDAIRDSGHTCWQEEMDNYAAAVAFLDEDPEVVGIDVQKDSRCQICHLQWRLRSLGETLPVEEPVFKADLTELLDMLTECSRRKVAWDDVLTSVQKEFICHADSFDSTEESEDEDGGSDVDEASEENERAPVTVIHLSQDNTPSHRENNPSSGLGQNEKAVDVDEESADAAQRLNFTNLLSKNPHPYSTASALC
ncbi:hypothetical protein C8J56DRAFT_890848 [Mycena floridula]|nr:hypothetical protein C8J56DRAFT_890848 [Mycena floridula]